MGNNASAQTNEFAMILVRDHFPRRRAAAIVVAGLVLSVSVETLADQYSITDLGHGVAYAINNAGQVAGRSFTTGRPVLWDNGTEIDLGTLGPLGGVAWGLNDVGQVVGATNTAGGALHAFLWEQGTMVDLATSENPRSEAFAINNSGQVVGGSGAVTAVIWDDGRPMMSIGSPSGGDPFSEARDINDAGQIVGYAAPEDGPAHAFLWNVNEEMRDLGSLPGTNNSLAHDINDLEQVVGGSGGDPFVWTRDTGMLGLDTLWPGNWTTATAINNAGQIVGFTTRAGGGPGEHAFLWMDGTMTDLDKFLEPGSLWELTEAWGINEAGQIVGRGMLNGERRAFVLSPIPEPGAVAFLTLGAFAFVGRRGASRRQHACSRV